MDPWLLLRRRILAAMVAALLAAGLLIFLYRGLIGAMRGGSSDFAIFYTASRVWLHGGNPYDMPTVQAEWDKLIPADIWRITDRGPVLLYPPAAFVVLAPLAILPFKAAAAAWAVLNTCFCAVAIWSVARLSQLRGIALTAFVAACLLLFPLASGLRYGQTAAITVACVAAGARLRANGRQGPGGALQGIAAVIKPQLAILFIVYEAGRFRWRHVAAAIAAGSTLLAIGAGRLWAAGVPWLESWRQQVHDFQLVGDGDPTPSNLVRSQIINLHYPLHEMIESRDTVSVLVYAIVGGLCAVYFLVDHRRGRQAGEGRGEIVSLAMTAVATLLVAYHRSYDATVLIFVAGAGAAILSSCQSLLTSRRWAWAVAALLLVFLFPLTSELHILEQHGWDIRNRHITLPPSIAQSVLWRIVIMPHEVWALLAMTACLIGIRASLVPATPEVTQRST